MLSCAVHACGGRSQLHMGCKLVLSPGIQLRAKLLQHNWHHKILLRCLLMSLYPVPDPNTTALRQMITRKILHIGLNSIHSRDNQTGQSCRSWGQYHNNSSNEHNDAMTRSLMDSTVRLAADILLSEIQRHAAGATLHRSTYSMKPSCPSSVAPSATHSHWSTYTCMVA